MLFTHIRTKRHSKLGLTLTNTCLDESLKRSGSIITQLLCLGIQVPWENQTFKRSIFQYYVKGKCSFFRPYQTMQLNWKALDFLLLLLILNGAFDWPFFDPSANRGNRAWWPKLSFKLYSATYKSCRTNFGVQWFGMGMATSFESKASLLVLFSLTVL